MLPESEQQTTEIFERVMAQATQDPFSFEDREIPIQFSVGVAPWKWSETFENALQNADKALYEAKSRCGCTVVNFAELQKLNESHKNARQ